MQSGKHPQRPVRHNCRHIITADPDNFSAYPAVSQRPLTILLQSQPGALFCSRVYVLFTGVFWSLRFGVERFGARLAPV